MPPDGLHRLHTQPVTRMTSTASTKPPPSPQWHASRRRQIQFVALISLSLLTYFLIRTRTPGHPDTTTTDHLLKSLTLQAAPRKLSDKVVYSRYARVYNRILLFEDGKQYEFDVWGRNWRNESFGVVTVIPFDVKTKTFTLVREYNIAHEKFIYTWPQGQFERAKHKTALEAAKSELGEEARLKCGNWHMLIDACMPQDKYQRECVYVYLCMESAQGYGGRDEEERIEVVKGVTTEQVRMLGHVGVMQSNNVAAGYMGIDKLKRMRLLPWAA